MSVSNYYELREHIGHTVEVVGYGTGHPVPWNVAIECIDCSEVLLDFDHPDAS